MNYDLIHQYLVIAYCQTWFVLYYCTYRIHQPTMIFLKQREKQKKLSSFQFTKPLILTTWLFCQSAIRKSHAWPATHSQYRVYRLLVFGTSGTRIECEHVVGHSCSIWSKIERSQIIPISFLKMSTLLSPWVLVFRLLGYNLIRVIPISMEIQFLYNLVNIPSNSKYWEWNPILN